MKTLMKNDEIKRVKDSDFIDRKKIDEMLQAGWKFVPKSEWKSRKNDLKKEDIPTESKKDSKKRVKSK